MAQRIDIADRAKTSPVVLWEAMASIGEAGGCLE